MATQGHLSTQKREQMYYTLQSNSATQGKLIYLYKYSVPKKNQQKSKYLSSFNN